MLAASSWKPAALACYGVALWSALPGHLFLVRRQPQSSMSAPVTSITSWCIARSRGRRTWTQKHVQGPPKLLGCATGTTRASTHFTPPAAKPPSHPVGSTPKPSPGCPPHRSPPSRTTLRNHLIQRHAQLLICAERCHLCTKSEQFSPFFREAFRLPATGTSGSRWPP